MCSGMAHFLPEPVCASLPPSHSRLTGVGQASPGTAIPFFLVVFVGPGWLMTLERRPSRPSLPLPGGWVRASPQHNPVLFPTPSC